MATRKKKPAGFSARKGLLSAAGFGQVIEEVLSSYRRKDVARDDVLDACICCWTGERILVNTTARVSAEPPADSGGLRREIWR